MSPRTTAALVTLFCVGAAILNFGFGLVMGGLAMEFYLFVILSAIFGILWWSMRRTV